MTYSPNPAPGDRVNGGAYTPRGNRGDWLPPRCATCGERTAWQLVRGPQGDDIGLGVVIPHQHRGAAPGA